MTHPSPSPVSIDLEGVKARIATARSVCLGCRADIERLAVRSRRDDAPLRDFLAGLALEEGRSEAQLAALVGGAPPRPAASVLGPLGEQALGRDAALYHAELVDKERTRRFSELARGLPEGAARILLLAETERGAPRLILLRNILLAGSSEDPSKAGLTGPVRNWLVDALSRLVFEVRDGRGHVRDLRSVYEGGVASGSDPGGSYAALLDVLARSRSPAEEPLSAGLERLAKAEGDERIVAVARELLATLVERPA